MERESFLDSVAARLGRARQKAAPERAPVKAPWRVPDAPLATHFTSELERVGGTWARADSAEALLSELGSAISASGRAPVVAARRVAFEALGIDTSGAIFAGVSFFGEGGCDSPESFRRRALHADLGISTAICGIASTGTLLLAGSAESPRSVSLLPRRHLAVLCESQIVPDLKTAFSQTDFLTPSSSGMPSALFCITGPSRTSDIENDLSIGVHGPAQVHVIVYSAPESVQVSGAHA